nr:UDP-glycosyltransferase 13-like [Coffea arabica]
MSMSRIGDSQKRAVAHVALFPSAGIGHLVPFLRLAAMLASPNCQCRVTLIAVQPPVSGAESNELSNELSAFFASHPQINRLDFHLPIPSSPSEFADAEKPDPFFARFLDISSSVHLLHPLLASLSTPPLSAIFADFAVAADINRLADELSIPLYIGAGSFTAFPPHGTIRALTALSKEQIRELRNGLERSGCRFLWAIKTTKVGKDEREDLQDLLGSSFLERTKKKGLVCKGWVEQEQVSAHPVIGGFVSHCGWNSVTEAARFGVPILAWPLNGDQKLNAEVTEKAGLGVWMRHWGWLGENLVKGQEIGDQIIQLMQDKTLRVKAKKVKEEARKAYEVGGSSKKVLLEIIENL